MKLEVNGIADMLRGDPVLMGQATGAYYFTAPPGQVFPYVIYSLDSGSDVQGFVGAVAQSQLFVFKVLDRRGSVDRANGLYELLKERVQQGLSIPGLNEVYRFTEESVFTYVEDSTDEVPIWNVGGRFRQVVS